MKVNPRYKAKPEIIELSKTDERVAIAAANAITALNAANVSFSGMDLLVLEFRAPIYRGQYSTAVIYQSRFNRCQFEANRYGEANLSGAMLTI